MLKNDFEKYKNKLNLVYRRYRIRHNKNFKISNRDVSIIASNCNGGVLASDLKLRFNSPFVNLWIKPDEYIKMLYDLENYLKHKLTFISEDKVDYPIGLLLDVRIYFQHYDSEKAAYEAWERRKKRINYENIVVLFTDRDECTYKDLLEFDKLPYERKVVFTKKNYPEIESSHYIHGFENEDSVGVLSDFRKDKIGVRYFDEFDFRRLID